MNVINLADKLTTFSERWRPMMAAIAFRSNFSATDDTRLLKAKEAAQ
jgi:hypothetical protein